MPDRRGDARREQIIDAAFAVFARQGFDATSAEHIATEAGLSTAEFAEYFATSEAVLMSIVHDLSHATAAELSRAEKGGEPERALLEVGTAVLTAVAEGRGVVPIERLLAMARIVRSTRNLPRKVSAARRRVIAPALAEWMGVSPENRRLKRALTMWSAVMASAYVTVTDRPDHYEPRHDEGLRQRMIANVTQSYGEVMGDGPAMLE